MARWYRAALDEAGREITAGGFTTARARLLALAVRWPKQAEVHYQLGICELALGRLDEAMAAWARVPAGSKYSERAALHRAQAALALGRYAEVERTLRAALRHPGPLVAEVRRQLARNLRFQGRLDEVARLIEADWEGAADPLGLLREHAALDLEAFPAEGVRAILEEAARKAPDDDGIWLGRAFLATLSGRFDQAETWLDSCAQRRPDDPAVWSARLDWAMAAARDDDVRRALARLPADPESASRAVEIRAWLAARRGDTEAEREALLALVEQVPGRFAALERLADLAYQAGQSDEAAALRRRRADLDRAKHRYRNLVAGADPGGHPAELARLAESLGRRFEARGFWTLHLRRHPDDPEARDRITRLEQGPALPVNRGRLGHTAARTLADLVVEREPKARSSSGMSVSPGRLARTTDRAPAFTDDADAVGLRFVHRNGQTRLRQLPETQSGGVAVLDYDGDGWLDVYCVQGGPFPPEDSPSSSTVSRSTAQGDRLFRNRGDGTFEDTTERSGIGGTSHGYGHGITVGDYDNDGRPDLFVTRWRAYALYHNAGDGTFEDVTESAGLGGDRDWPTSAAFADLDGDGDLDLYVCHYLAWDARNPRICRDPQTSAYIYCMPHVLDTLPDHLFRNDGGRFVDVTAEAGVVDRDGPGLGVVAADLDDDGRIDLYVANDGTANFLFRNKGGFRFEEVGVAAGVAAGGDGGFYSGMGVDCGDLDGDGRLDLVVTNFYGQGTTFYHNLGRGSFADRTAAIGLLAASRSLLGFGVALFDCDDDGRLDLATANGHVNDLRPNFPYAMPAQLLAGSVDGRLVDVSDRAGPPWRVPRIGRGLAAGDLDNDGRGDLLVLGQNAPLAYFHNLTRGGHSLTLRLEGNTSNRDGIGATVRILAGGREQVAQRMGGGSYQSASDPRLHFGLGPCRRVDSVEVRWPSGRIDRFRDLAADAGYCLREGAPTPRPLPGRWGRHD
jgi:tetratricopeptide (TPR) repeat protein